MKSVIRLLIILAIIMTSLSANVQLKALSYFIENEPYYFSLEASGSDIDFPYINSIDGFAVQPAGQSSNYSSINGVVSNKIIKRYKLLPNKAFTIPSFELTIDGKKVQTAQKMVIKKKMQQTQSTYFEFNLKAKKEKLYVGESTVVTLQFKHRQDVKIMDFQLNFNGFNNFWHKSIDENRQYQEQDFIVQELDFLVFPQKSGTLSINPMSMDIVVMDNSNNSFSLFSNPTKRLKVYSNELSFDVQSLPQDVHLVGNFSMQAKADKLKVKHGQSVNFKILIKGEGNIDDIQLSPLNIQDITIYDNQPNIQGVIKDGHYQGSFEKSFSMVANKSFTIPSISLNYFDLKTQTVKTIATKAIDIEVEGVNAPSKKVTLEKLTSDNIPSKVHVVHQNDLQDKILFFILGVLMTLLSIGLYFYVINKKTKTKEELPLQKRIKASKNNQELLFVMLAYIDYNEELKQILLQLEKSTSNEFKNNKKLVLDTIKKYQIKG